MVLEKKDIQHIATLCNLELSPDEVTTLSSALTQTLDYIAILNELDTLQVSETYQVTGLTNVYKNDKSIVSTLDSEDSLSGAKKVIDGKFATEAVFDRE